MTNLLNAISLEAGYQITLKWQRENDEPLISRAVYAWLPEAVD
jgi:hypothetical protein